jgi:hypothetical protein
MWSVLLDAMVYRLRAYIEPNVMISVLRQVGEETELVEPVTSE